VINTSSSSGIYGNVGQTNYGTARAGIAAFTIIASQELGRYGVTVNAVAPAAATRLTQDLNPSGQLPPRASGRVRPSLARRSNDVVGQCRVGWCDGTCH
jgi:NAD(P)-dependent dehydrogenase (short-subunit alcohol dehydrogenase family)